jgi:hypothetical protein
LLLSPIGFIGAVIGILRVRGVDRRAILYSWLAAIVIYFYVLAGVNTGHIYYHLPLLPVAAIFFGYAYELIINDRGRIMGIFKKRIFMLPGMGLVLLIFAGYGFGYYKYFSYMYGSRMPYTLEAAKIVTDRMPSNRFIVVTESGLVQPVFSYYSKSKVYPFSIGSKSIVEDLEKLRGQGATAYVALDSNYGDVVKLVRGKENFWHHLNEKYKLIAMTDHYIIFDLTASNQGGGK